MSSVTAYVSSTSNTVDRLDMTIGKEEQYKSILNLFEYKIENSNNKDKASTVITGLTPTLKNLGGIGFCGANELCKLYPPLSCYICPKFVAWSDGPHQQMLDELKNHIDFLKNQSGNPSDRIHKQLSEVMEAILSVIVAIKSQNNE